MYAIKKLNKINEVKKPLNYFERLSILVNEKPKDNWMKDWMEQAKHFIKKTEANNLITNDVGGFITYAEKLEEK